MSKHKTITVGGEQKLRILKIEAVPVPWDNDNNQVNLVLDVMTEDLGDDFEGFFIDYKDQSKGRYPGQIGRVRASEWAFSNFSNEKFSTTTEEGIGRFLKSLLYTSGKKQWYDDNIDLYPEYNGLIAAINKEKVLKNIYFEMTIGGRGYVDKNGYTKYDLYLPKCSKEEYPYILWGDDEAKSSLLKYNPQYHMIPPKEGAGNNKKQGATSSKPAAEKVANEYNDDLPF